MRVIVFVVLFLFSMQVFADPSADLEERFKALEKRLTELEADHSLQSFRLSGFLVTTYDDLSVSQTFPTANALNNDHLDYLRLLFSLNADFDLSPHVKIYSRLTTTKLFNKFRSEGGQATVSRDFDPGHSYTSATVYLEKAYIDYLPGNGDFVFSIGRLPTTDGPPANFWDLRSRAGTYPFMNFNLPLDGIAASYKFDSYLDKSEQLSLRVMYTPLLTVALGSNAYLKPPHEDDLNDVGTGNKVNTMSEAGAVQVDYSRMDMSFADQGSALLHVTYLGDRVLSAGTGTSTARINGSITSLYAELIGIANTGFDMTASFSYSAFHSNGSFGAGLGGLGTMGDSSDIYGDTTVLNARYRWDQWAVGAEWLTASKLVRYFSTADEDLVGFYRTPGIGRHIYVTRKFADFLTLRLGYREKDLSNFLVGVGPVVDTDRQIKNFYALLRADF